MPARTFEKDLALFRIEKIKNPIQHLANGMKSSNAHPRLAYSTSTTFVHYAQNENPITALGQWEEGLERSSKISI
jgi:hypothetical protein